MPWPPPPVPWPTLQETTDHATPVSGSHPGTDPYARFRAGRDHRPDPRPRGRRRRPADRRSPGDADRPGPAGRARARNERARRVSRRTPARRPVRRQHRGPGQADGAGLAAYHRGPDRPAAHRHAPGRGRDRKRHRLRRGNATRNDGHRRELQLRHPGRGAAHREPRPDPCRCSGAQRDGRSSGNGSVCLHRRRPHAGKLGTAGRCRHHGPPELLAPPNLSRGRGGGAAGADRRRQRPLRTLFRWRAERHHQERRKHLYRYRSRANSKPTRSTGPTRPPWVGTC